MAQQNDTMTLGPRDPGLSGYLGIVVLLLDALALTLAIVARVVSH